MRENGAEDTFCPEKVPREGVEEQPEILYRCRRREKSRRENVCFQTAPVLLSRVIFHAYEYLDRGLICISDNLDMNRKRD